MVIRTKKNVPLYEKLGLFDEDGLFTEAPRRKKKRIINVRTSRGRDYTANVDPEEEVELNNISPEEDNLSGETDGLDFENPDDTEGGMTNELPVDTNAGTDPAGTTDTGSDVQSADVTTDQQPSDGAGASGTNPPEGTSGSASGNTPDGTGSPETGSANNDGSLTGVPGEDGTPAPDNVSGEPQTGEVPPADTSAQGGDNTVGTAGGDPTVQASTAPAGGTRNDENIGTENPPAENPDNTNGEGNVGDVTAQPNPTEAPATEGDPNAANEVIEIDDPSAGEDDFTAGVDTGDIPAEGAAPADPNAAAANPNAVDPNAAVNADLEAFDKNDMRKYQLFKRFIDLHDVVTYFISVLESIIPDDANFGEIISKVTKNLKKVEEIVKDYMVLKFQSDSYLQNSFFFEKAKASILLALGTLKQGKNRRDGSKQ